MFTDDLRRGKDTGRMIRRLSAKAPKGGRPLGDPPFPVSSFSFLCEGEAVDGFAFEGFVGVEVLAGGFDIAMAH